MNFDSLGFKNHIISYFYCDQWSKFISIDFKFHPLVWFNVNIIADYVELFSSDLVAWASLASKFKPCPRMFLSFFFSKKDHLMFLPFQLFEFDSCGSRSDRISLAMKELLTWFFFKAMYVACVLSWLWLQLVETLI